MNIDLSKETQELFEYLTDNDLTVTFAESCTAGLLAANFCDIPGVSSVFKGSLVSYSDEVKVNNLNVKPFTINEYSAVSEQTALEMAVNAAKMFNADCAISVTGYAGPAGGTKVDPVGTFYIGMYDRGFTLVTREYLPGLTRNELRQKACEYAFMRFTENIVLRNIKLD